MPAALDLLTRGIRFVASAFGETAFTIRQPGAAGAVLGAFSGQWNDLGREEVVELNGRRISFSVTVEATRSQFTELPKEGQIVMRSSDGFTGRIVGEVQSDELTVRFAVDSRHTPRK